MKVHLVISFDLGLQGDYSNLYSWLDEHNAMECGNGLAALVYDVEDATFEAVYGKLKNELQEKINIAKTDRLYLIMKDKEGETMKGKFLFGNRKRAPWEGYYMREPDKADIF